MALIMSLTSMKMLTNMAYLQYHPRNATSKPSWKFGNQNEIPIELSR